MTGITWSVRVADADTGEVLMDEHPTRTLRTASVGKVLLLVRVAELIESGAIDPARPLRRTPDQLVADSGVWQHLRVDELPVEDLCVLVGMVSDNLATNVLLARVGLPAVAATAAGLGLVRTGLHDRVRDVRTPADPPTLSTGSADELVRLMVGLRPPVTHWLSNGVDLSQVAAGWGLDPLAHQAGDLGLHLVNKTGTDHGVRADVGVLTGPARRIGYAVLANFPGGDQNRATVLERQRALGLRIAGAARGNW
ncbi:beta-lactamase class A [Nakamurella panacisegetis]|uniref:Beta-lactamase class A n=1 Tax=Nakamurella panacisegetis TaxID=1090615 RepID=A0A1H0SJE3_9ACTN|nr:serine hydrolase [Nakamurella panacisegetis]SDP41775.1 beta-lactamase class A [Nakamurella panacisegetis]